MSQYYSIAGTTVAMRVGAYGDTPEEWSFFLTDHLGSVVGVTNDAGALTGETRYLPFGEVRTDVGTAITQTDFGYTFQRVNNYIKLLDYRFRSYSPELGRFVSPDTIVPDFSNPQSLNRYSYVNNRPIVFSDPTGHMACNKSNPDGTCERDNDFRIITKKKFNRKQSLIYRNRRISNGVL